MLGSLASYVEVIAGSRSAGRSDCLTGVRLKERGCGLWEKKKREFFLVLVVVAS